MLEKDLNSTEEKLGNVFPTSVKYGLNMKWVSGFKVRYIGL